MHKNIFWQAFLVVIFVITVWYTVAALYSYYFYSHLSIEKNALAIEWKVEKKSDDIYFLNAFYRFDFEGKVYFGNRVLTEEPYRNTWAAQEAIKEFTDRQWKVWFDPQNPARSSLQKTFPFKECLSAVFLWGLLFYFLWLGFYVAKFKT